MNFYSTTLVYAAALITVSAAAAADTTPASSQAAEDIASFASMGEKAAEAGKLELAERYYSRLLAIDAPDSAKKDALFGMFEAYRSHAIYSKAIAVGEKVHLLFPTDPETPQLLLNLGQLYRQIGAYQLATARFYNVLNAALRIDPTEFKNYKEYSMQAQFEIAETFMTAGDYAQAARTYTMLDKLELTAEQKAHAQFEVAYCEFMQASYKNAADAARRFLEAYGDTEYAPECHFVLSIALNALHQPEDATKEVMTLLRMETKLKDKNKDSWTYWKKKTGNQLANGFYQEGDYMRALTIYQEMAKLSDDPQWQWPVLYQVGLCFERLRLPDRAQEAYQYIMDQGKKMTADGKTLGDDLVELSQMADWRNQHLTWQQSTETQLSLLLGNRAPADMPKGMAPGDFNVSKSQ